MSFFSSFFLSIMIRLLIPLQGGDQHEVIVELTNLRSTDGMILASIYDDPKSFPKSRGMKEQQIITCIPGERMTIHFENLLPGTYAIAIMHDESGDEKMNFSLLGFPKEGYCFSNNVRPKFRKPTFDEAKFELGDNNKYLHIIMKY